MHLLPITAFISFMNIAISAQKEYPINATIPSKVLTKMITTQSRIASDTVMKLVWSDEFNYGSRPDSTKWGYNIGSENNGWGNNEAQYYTSDTTNARIEDGHLIIEARKENRGGKKYTSARLITQGKYSWTYGIFEIRAKLPKGLGTWPAIWMLGENITNVGWPTCGEIDIMEHVGKEQDVVNWSTHSKQNNWTLGTQRNSKAKIDGVSEDFHTYKMEWSKDYIHFFVDGKLYYTSVNDGKGKDYYPFNAPQFLILNFAVGGNMGGEIIDETIFPCKMEVDYIRVYQ